jgi:hypothetical protein
VTRVLDQERIETERLLLRSWDAADASVMQRELSKVEMARMLAIPYPYPEEGAEKWIPTARPGSSATTAGALSPPNSPRTPRATNPCAADRPHSI